MALFSDTNPRNEDSSNTSLKKINQILQTNSGGGGGGAVTIADGDDEALGAKADTAAADDTGSASLIALQKRGLTHLSTLLAYQFGLAGSDTEKDGVLSDVDYYAMKAITDVTIVNITLGAGHTGALNWLGETIYAGDMIYLSITAIEFTGTAQFFKVPA